MIGHDVVLESPAFIHPTAQAYGAVTIQTGASLWPNAVIRAEDHEVVIGPYTNIQDFVMVHVGYAVGTYIGSHCSITHHCTIHGCTIGDNCLIGINSTIMDGCVIGNNCIIAGHSFLKEGTVIPDNSIVMGAPGKVVKERDCREANRVNALWYYQNALGYAEGDHRRPSRPESLKAIEKMLAELS